MLRVPCSNHCALHVMFSLFPFVCVFVRVAYCNEVYNEGVALGGLVLKSRFDKEDPHCTHHIHKFYRQMRCEPEMSPESKCPTSYRCGTLEGRSFDRCYYAGRFYPVGFNLTKDMVQFHSPCVQSCQCVRMVEGARFYCSHDSPKVGDCPAAPGCRHFSFLEDFTCCQRGVISCNQGKRDSVNCVSGGSTYSEGEKFFPQDDLTCVQCICASGFNGSVAAPYCQQFSCDLELWGDTPVMLTRGCVPVYLSDHGCCPVSFRCPRPTDRVIKPDKTDILSSKSGKKCRFGHLTMEVGDVLSPWTETNTKEVECSCRIPPMASCVRRNFRLTEEMRRGFAREGLDSDHNQS